GRRGGLRPPLAGAPRRGGGQAPPGGGTPPRFPAGGWEAWPPQERTMRAMGRAAAGRRRARTPSTAGSSRRVVEECVGVALLGASLLAALGLASLHPGAPVVGPAAVADRARVGGAAA